jgi:hypothetical protein
VLTSLSSVYPNVEISRDLIDLWARALDDLNFATVQRGVTYCAKEHTTGFMPTPAEFRYYTLSGENAQADRARIQALHRETKQLGMKPLETVPMPDEFRKLFRKFTGKTNIKDAVRRNQEESAKRREADLTFFSEGKV